jgi:hypothetical protein
MTISVIHRALFSFACLFLALSALPERGGAAVTVPFPYLVGIWSGDYSSSVTRTSGALSLDIVTQDTRRFQGTWTFAPPTPNVPPSPCMVLGTVSESGEVTLGGQNDQFLLVAHGALSFVDGVITLDYLAQFADESFDMGSVEIALE